MIYLTKLVLTFKEALSFWAQKYTYRPVHTDEKQTTSSLRSAVRSIEAVMSSKLTLSLDPVTDIDSINNHNIYLQYVLQTY